VLETGGAYLPIDPDQPAERVSWMLQDSSAALLLTPEGLEETGGRAPGGTGTGPDGLAYVIYTSGSTGTPKGAELCHRGLSSLIAWHRRTYGLGPADRTTLLARPGFDASVWETWAPLAAGASLHVPPPEVVPAPSALLTWMAEEGITVSFLPTPLAEAVLTEPRPAGLALRLLLTGGDRLVRRPAADLPYALVNHYGPTESTVVATAGRVASHGEGAPEIGSPIANTRAYILDPSLRPVPVGVAGELCLAGEGLARGYRGRPELTAERFVPDPSPSGSAGARLYRTGDLARWRSGGGIEFLGRVDAQLKIRGYRIEPGEIEAALAAHPRVETAVVISREDAGGDKRLVAYVVLGSGATLEPAALRHWAQERLPGYMVPAAFVQLSELPLGATGKVDRRALPAPPDSSRAAGAELVAPRNPLEEEVAQVWAGVLGLERLGVEDNFWDLGGHSLLATKVLARINAAFGLNLPLQSLFTAPTLGEFADAVGEAFLADEGMEDALAELDGPAVPISIPDLT
jgi:amino acid adenylation domain-containing protein